ncbi:MFS transporter [Nocardia tengchongensis]|uniref:hypothetical protein n=1 Tax=Nocardia tengchongensis TaxID=2055889 RepID=UPI0036A5B3DB
MTTSLDTPDVAHHRARRPVGPARAAVGVAVAATATFLAFIDVVVPVGGFPIPGVAPKPPSPDAVAAALGLPAGVPVPPEVLAAIPTTLPAETVRPLLQGPLESYAIAFAIGLALLAVLGRPLGGRVFTLALAGFAFTSAVSAFAHEGHLLFTALVVQGVAGALMAAAALSTMVGLRPAAQAGVHTGAWWVVAAAGTGLGPVAGAYFVGLLDWSPQTFYATQAIVLSVLTAITWWAVPPRSITSAPAGAAALLSAAGLAAAATIATLVHPSTHVAPVAVLAALAVVALGRSASAAPAIEAAPQPDSEICPVRTELGEPASALQD